MPVTSGPGSISRQASVFVLQQRVELNVSALVFDELWWGLLA